VCNIRCDALEYESVTSKDFFNHLRNEEVGWLACAYKRCYKSFELFYKIFLGSEKIKHLSAYHHALYMSVRCAHYEYEKIYKPLGVDESEYFKPTYYSLEEIVNRVRSEEKILSLNGWWRAAGAWRLQEIEFARKPITVRELEPEKFEVMDGNHRIIAKALKEGFTFGCQAFVMCKQRH
jgi:hypothetical protein